MAGMNFVGHACLARDARGSGLFVFGAMLPDLAGIVGLSPPVEGPEELLGGLRHHRRVDGAFHGAPLFHELLQDGRAKLRLHGVPKGPRIAATHLGVELLLDGILVERDGIEALVFDALVVGRKALGDLYPPRGPELAWMERAIGHVSDGRLLDDYAHPRLVARRIERILERRVRCRLDAGHREELGRWLEDLRPRLVLLTDPLLAQTGERLAGET
jgi:hypothetical protein